MNDAYTQMHRAEDLFANARIIRELTDSNFWNIFYDRNKIIVVDFWATWCRPCDRVAEHLIQVAERYYTGPTGTVKFYHAQWDTRVNPQIHVRFGFPSLPVVYFYFTLSGRPPTHQQPLLEGSLGGDRGIPPIQAYVDRIEAIKHRHGL